MAAQGKAVVNKCGEKYMKIEYQENKNRQGILSVILKSLLIVTFLFIEILLLIGSVFEGKSVLVSNRMMFILGIIGYCIYLAFNRKKIPRSVIVENVGLAVSSLILLVVQLIIIYNIIFQTSWDVEAVWYGAHWAAIGDKLGLEQMSEYFSLCPNNLFLVVIFSSILKLNNMLGEPFSNGGLLLAIFQAIMINLAGLILFKCAKRFVTVANAWKIYFVYSILVGISGWIVLPYSDGMGVIFPILLLYIYIRIRECNGEVQRCGYILLLSVIAVVGYYVKPYTSIVFIAIIVIETTNWWKKLISNYSRTMLLTMMRNIVIGVITMVVCNTLILGMNRSVGFDLDKERAMGWQHYLMIGVNVESWGGYNDADLAFAKSFNDKEIRNKREMQLIVERIQNMGVKGCAELFAHKASKNFLDGNWGWGTDKSFYKEIYPSRSNGLCTYLRSWYYGFENLYCYNATIRQFIWIIVLIMIPFASFTLKTLQSEQKVLFLAVLGFMLYLQIFESHARYVFVFVPLFLILAFVGSENLKTLLNLFFQYKSEQK